MEPQNSGNQNSLLTFLREIPTVWIAFGVIVALLIIVGGVVINGLVNDRSAAEEVAQTLAQRITSTAVALAAIPTVTQTPTSSATPPPTATPSSTATATMTPTSTSTPTITPTFTPTPIIISWQELGELNTLEVSTTTVVEDVSQRPGLLPDANVLVQVTGTVNYGFDITAAQISNLAEIDRNSVSIVLPKAKVTGVELTNAEVLNQDWLPSAELGTSAVQKGLQQLETWGGEQDELLDIAERLGRLQLEDFLRGLGFEVIEIRFEDSGE